jgi:hypothetical protein
LDSKYFELSHAPLIFLASFVDSTSTRGLREITQGLLSRWKRGKSIDSNAHGQANRDRGLPEFRVFVDHLVSQVCILLNLVNMQLIVMISGGVRRDITRIVGSSAPFGPMGWETLNGFEVSYAGGTAGEPAALASLCHLGE